MGKKLFVGNLSWTTSNEALRDLLSQFGELSEVKIVTDRDTGRSRGFAFVTFADGAAAERAAAALNGTTLDGRAIKVNEAQDRREGGGGGYRGDRQRW